jgi:hypothetical protein
MAHQVIRYRLTAQGTVPDFLYLGNDGVGGVYGVPDPATPSPRDLTMIGITKDGATGDFEVIATKDALQAYLTVVGADWEEPAVNPDDPPVPFDPVKAANWVWGRLDALNA